MVQRAGRLPIVVDMIVAATPTSGARRSTVCCRSSARLHRIFKTIDAPPGDDRLLRSAESTLPATRVSLEDDIARLHDLVPYRRGMEVLGEASRDGADARLLALLHDLGRHARVDGVLTRKEAILRKHGTARSNRCSAPRRAPGHHLSQRSTRCRSGRARARPTAQVRDRGLSGNHGAAGLHGPGTEPRP